MLCVVLLFMLLWKSIIFVFYFCSCPKLATVKNLIHWIALLIMVPVKHDVDTLIKSMISPDPNERPDIKNVQAHHMFWDSTKKLLFIQVKEVFQFDLNNELFAVFYNRESLITCLMMRYFKKCNQSWTAIKRMLPLIGARPFPKNLNSLGKLSRRWKLKDRKMEFATF